MYPPILMQEGHNGPVMLSSITLSEPKLEMIEEKILDYINK